MDVPLTMADQVGGGRHLKLQVDLGGTRIDAIFFSHSAQALGISVGDRVDLAFTPQINEFRGHCSVQLVVSALRRHDGRDLCRRILEQDKNAAYAAAAFCPSRADFVRVWRILENHPPLASAPEGILARCPRDMEPERFCLCLAVFSEAGLLYSDDGSVYRSRYARLEKKADLDATKIMRILHSL